ncbi:glycosyltransferase family 4 protein [Algoriphagus namhaensis]|uniref:Glycosyltransferase family 4 protein n=1 Tax=Algoriphagus namhaensis TaxID=915353 RepID=A0ABV8AVC5_9BACT
MHICFLSQEFPKPGAIYGGIGTFLSTFTKELLRQGHHVTVLGIGFVDIRMEEIIEGVRVITIPHRKSKVLAWRKNYQDVFTELVSIHTQTPIDIIEGSELNFAFLKRHSDFTYVIRLHGGHHFFAEGENRKVNRWKSFQEKRSFQKAVAFIAVSDYVKVHTGKLLSFGGKRVEVINYPVPLTKFYEADPDKVVKGKLVFAGTVCEKKGIRQLILALPEIIEKFPEVHLEVYGRDSRDSQGLSFTEMLKESTPAEILEKINFHGPVSHDDLPKYYEQAEICVFPSHMETQGLVAPEAMSMGKPVIFSDKGPGPETIDHGVTGWLCDPLDPRSIAQTVIQALQGREKLGEIGAAARKKVHSKFDPELITKKNVAFYSEILRSK